MKSYHRVMQHFGGSPIRWQRGLGVLAALIACGLVATACGSQSPQQRRQGLPKPGQLDQTSDDETFFASVARSASGDVVISLGRSGDPEEPVAVDRMAVGSHLLGKPRRATTVAIERSQVPDESVANDTENVHPNSSTDPEQAADTPAALGVATSFEDLAADNPLSRNETLTLKLVATDADLLGPVLAAFIKKYPEIASGHIKVRVALAAKDLNLVLGVWKRRAHANGYGPDQVIEGLNRAPQIANGDKIPLKFPKNVALNPEIREYLDHWLSSRYRIETTTEAAVAQVAPPPIYGIKYTDEFNKNLQSLESSGRRGAIEKAISEIARKLASGETVARRPNTNSKVGNIFHVNFGSKPTYVVQIEEGKDGNGAIKYTFLTIKKHENLQYKAK